MSARPLPRGLPRTGGYLAIEGRIRRRPGTTGLVRRRWAINTAKWLLPAGALLLLSSIALWPELERATDKARVAMRGMGAAIEGGRVKNARYNGIDERGRPYTVTAVTARQDNPDRVRLEAPKADMSLENGTWMFVRAKQGVYTQQASQLDLSGDVVLYRDDGTTMTTETATLDVHGGAATGAEKTHVEGPFGTVDATGFTVLDKGAALQFWGPAHAVLNAVSQ